MPWEWPRTVHLTFRRHGVGGEAEVSASIPEPRGRRHIHLHIVEKAGDVGLMIELRPWDADGL